MEFLTQVAIYGLLFVVALLYSSVGLGGASSYLAILSFLFLAPALMSTTALMLNVLVAGVAFIFFYRAGHFAARLTWPFLIASIPTAFLGGMIHTPVRIYSLLLAGVLLFAALRLVVEIRHAADDNTFKLPSLFVALAAGAGIGLISGIVGVGGGIFLSPLILLMKWADPKRTAATSACFVLVNSLSALSGRFVGGSFEVGMLASFVLAAFLGGVVGSHLGANLFSGRILRSVLGVLLLVASYRLFTVAL